MNAVHCFHCKRVLGPYDDVVHGIQTNDGWLCLACATFALQTFMSATSALPLPKLPPVYRWTPLGPGVWGVKATQRPFPVVGSVVTVTKRDGATSQVRLNTLVYEHTSEAVYSVPQRDDSYAELDARWDEVGAGDDEQWEDTGHPGHPSNYGDR